MPHRFGRGDHVLIIVENLSVPFDRRVWQEALALISAGFDVSVICPISPEHPAREETIEGIRIYRHPLPTEARGAASYVLEYGAALLHQIRLACKIYCRQPFNIVHAANPPDTIFLVAGVFKVLFGVKFVFDHHDLNPELYEAKFGRRGLIYWLLVALEKWTFRLADISIATNGSYREIAIRRGGMMPDRVYIVRSGPDLRRVRLMPAEPALKNGRKHLIGYVGVMGSQEGIPYLLEAARTIVRDFKRDDVHFCLVGGGPELQAMKSLAGRLGIADHVTFTGRVPDVTLLSVLSTADVCVNPDEFNAMNNLSTMNKIMEYMALGKPIVQFDVVEGRVSALGASLYAKPNNAHDLAEKILELVNDPALRERMGALGRERVRSELSWDHEEPKLLHAYRELKARVTAAKAPAGVSVGPSAARIT